MSESNECEHKFVQLVVKEDGINYLTKRCVNCGVYHNEYTQLKQTKYSGSKAKR